MGISADEWGRLLLEGAAELGLAVSEAELAAYREHFALLLECNERAGLTAITDPASAAIKHFVDSLTCLLVRDITPGERVADVGSGAGFPGLVLAVARPAASYLLIESVRRRAEFLAVVKERLGLGNVTVLTVRAEDVGRDAAHRERCDVAVGRAVGSLPVMLEYCLPLVRVGGAVIVQKGREVQKELERASRALEVLGGRVSETRRLCLPNRMGQRVLILIEKVAHTPPRYPRRAGLPAKRPL